MATRFAKTFPLDDPAAVDGDAGFIGVNARLAPETLQPGWVADAENFEFRAGTMRTRRGLQTPAWARPGVALLGAGVARHPTQRTEGTLLAAAGTIYFARPGVPARALALPSGRTLSGRTHFLQAFDRVLAFEAAAADGTRPAPLQWEGGDWFEIDRTDAPDGTRPIPLADRAELLNDRVLVITEDGQNVDISDIGEIGKYPILSRVRCDVGRADSIVRVFPFTQDGALVFKGRSLLLISGISGTLPNLRVDVINPELGTIAGDSIASTGGDALFLSSNGVYRVQQIVQERLQTAPVAVSQDIEPILRQRINWRAAAGACAAVWEDCYYLAVPIDGSTANNAILSFNFVNQAWEGVHTFPAGVQLDTLTLATIGGKKRLMATDFAAGRQYLLYEDFEDCLPAGPADIACETTLRSYLAGAAGRKRWSTIQVDTSEWHAEWGAALLVDGVSESAALYPPTLTRSRTRNTMAGRRAWDATNARDDHGDAGREDYAVILQPALVLGSGIVLSREQDFTNRFSTQEIGRTCAVRVRGLRGRLTIRGVQAEGTHFDRAFQPTT